MNKATLLNQSLNWSKTQSPREYRPEAWGLWSDEFCQTLVIDAMAKGDTHPVSLKINALLIRAYGDEARVVILARRAKHRQDTAMRQYEWRTKVSRRPLRGRHHDSWSIREKYCRATLGSPVSLVG